MGITNDMIRENSENFFLDLAPPLGQTLERVDINPNLATVTIEDDDGEFSSDVVVIVHIHTTNDYQ